MKTAVIIIFCTFIANRSVERAQKLADEFDGEAIGLQHISEHLHRSDILIASTASPLPIIGKGTVERALKQRKHEPIFMVDLAVPRDIEPEVNELDAVEIATFTSGSPPPMILISASLRPGLQFISIALFSSISDQTPGR